MTETYTKIFTDSSIIINGLKHLLDDASISSRISDRVESARLGGFGVPTNSVELFILNTDLEKATPIVEAYKAKINA
jgi:hypothetical protein